MSSPLDSSVDVENGYGASDAKSDTGTSETCSSSSDNVALSVDDEGQTDDSSTTTTAKRHSWLLPFFVNIFLACASFSIVMPSLTPYLLDIGASISFLPWVVSSYSVGEMFGSVAIGHYYEYATKTYTTIGRGPRMSMLLCIGLGVIGSALYAAAAWIDDTTIAKYCILGARLIQGIWTGGQQAVEQGKFHLVSSTFDVLYIHVLT